MDDKIKLGKISMLLDEISKTKFNMKGESGYDPEEWLDFYEEIHAEIDDILRS